MHGHPWTNNKLEHYAIQFWHLHIIYSKAPFSSWKERPYMYTLHSLVPKVILYRYPPASVTQKNRNVNIRPPAAHIWHRIVLWVSVHYCPNFYWSESAIYLEPPKCVAPSNKMVFLFLPHRQQILSRYLWVDFHLPQRWTKVMKWDGDWLIGRAVKSSKWDQMWSGKGWRFEWTISNPIVQYILKYINILKFFNVESLTNRREFYFAGCDGPRGSNPPKWNKMEQSIDRLSAFISFWQGTNYLVHIAYWLNLSKQVGIIQKHQQVDGLGKTKGD